MSQGPRNHEIAMKRVRLEKKKKNFFLFTFGVCDKSPDFKVSPAKADLGVDYMGKPMHPMC